MKVDFIAGDAAGTFTRSNLNGRAVLRLGENSVTLQSPWNPSTHFSFSTTKTWRAELGGHEILVTKQRARLFGGFRDSGYQIIVDGREVERWRAR